LCGVDSVQVTQTADVSFSDAVHDVPLHDIVSVEHYEDTYDLEDEEQTFKYRVAFEYLTRGSLDPAESHGGRSRDGSPWRS
jgi:hypothetical protein